MSRILSSSNEIRCKLMQRYFFLPVLYPRVLTNSLIMKFGHLRERFCIYLVVSSGRKLYDEAKTSRFGEFRSVELIKVRRCTSREPVISHMQLKFDKSTLKL